MTLRRLLPAVLALALAAPAAAPANPLAANTLGAGTVTGSVACGSSATAIGTVVNTVITGYVGSFSITAPCHGGYSLSVTGTAVTGSTLRCTHLAGTYATDGVTEHADVIGVCHINDYPTRVRWRIDGAAFTVEKA